MTTRVMVADGEPLFREGLVQLLATRPDLHEVTEAADTAQAVELARRDRPDVVLVGLDLPVAGGRETARRIRRISPNSKVIMLMPPRGDDGYVGVREDVHAVLHASARAEQIFERIRTVRDGDGPCAVCTPMPLAPQELDDRDATEDLTCRERQVLALIARAWSNRQIEDALGIRNSTVKQHVRRILRKLHARNRVQAAVFASRASATRNEGGMKS